MARRGLAASAVAGALLVALGCRPAPAGSCTDAPASTASVATPAAFVLGDDPYAWPGPHCLAYSPRLAAYACVRLAATPTEASGVDLSSPSMAETVALVRRLGAELDLGVELVSAHGAQVRWVIDENPDRYSPRPLTPLAAVREELERRGYTVPITTRAVLEPEAWVAVGEVELRFTWEIHEGDASFEYFGLVELRCTPGGPVHEVPLDPDHVGGPFAVVSSAAGATVHAVTFEHQDGGEGYVSPEWYSWLVDEALFCP